VFRSHDRPSELAPPRTRSGKPNADQGLQPELKQALKRDIDLEVPINIGGIRPHFFDLATAERDVVAECKAFSFTVLGRLMGSPKAFLLVLGGMTLERRRGQTAGAGVHFTHEGSTQSRDEHGQGGNVYMMVLRYRIAGSTTEAPSGPCGAFPRGRAVAVVATSASWSK